MSGKADVFTVPVAGGKPVNITGDRDIWDYKPSWSFDGDWITFSRKETTPNFNIYLMRTDGSEREQITFIEGPVPMRGGRVSMSNQNVLDQRWSNWTKDGRIGWHQINAQAGQLRAVNVETGESAVLFDGEFAVNDLALSPDQRTLVFEADAIIYTMEAKPGATAKEVASGLSPRWSRDGKSIAYRAGWPSRPNRVDLATGDSVTFDQDITASWPAAANDPWSPDGTRLALIRKTDSAVTLVVATADGDEKVLVSEGASKSAPIWSSDGKWILYAENVPPSVTYCLSDAPVRPGSMQTTKAQ
jgi:Tol biopolymer transport system component